MMKYFLACLIFLLAFASPALAIYDPQSVSNNRLGVHILSPDEIGSAAKLVNNDGKGAWGYVTVPIQATDRNREKWLLFMKQTRDLKIIPIIRVATTADGARWLEPENNDLIDFANFLNELPWPTLNRYVIIFNEVNRPDEYGGVVSPENYADILGQAHDIFKSRSDNFFILPSAMDNAAPNDGQYLRWDTYLTRMYRHRPEVFNQIDGWNSHAYPNPAFSASPVLSGANKVDSFKSDLVFVSRFTKKKLPVFITEAGWSENNLDDRTIATFFNHAFYNIWTNARVVAVTPFLLFAGTSPFSQFSLLGKDHQPGLAYRAIQTFATVGEPKLDLPPPPTPGPVVTAVATSSGNPAPTFPVGDLTIYWQKILKLLNFLFRFDKFTHQLSVSGKTYQVEIVSSVTDLARGLAKYDSLSADHGMYFKLGFPHRPNFWMKDMKFDIDIIWLNNNRVVGIDRGLAKFPLTLIPAPSVVDAVLEVNPNSGVKVGDTVIIK